MHTHKNTWKYPYFGIFCIHYCTNHHIYIRLEPYSDHLHTMSEKGSKKGVFCTLMTYRSSSMYKIFTFTLFYTLTLHSTAHSITYIQLPKSMLMEIWPNCADPKDRERKRMCIKITHNVCATCVHVHTRMAYFTCVKRWNVHVQNGCFSNGKYTCSA